MEWFQSHTVPVVLGLFATVTAIVIALNKLFDAIKAFWVRLSMLRHPRQDKHPDQAPSQTKQSSKARSTTVKNPRASGHHSVNVRNMNQPLIILGSIFGNRTQGAQERRSRRQATSQQGERAVEQDASRQPPEEDVDGAAPVDDQSLENAASHLASAPAAPSLSVNDAPSRDATNFAESEPRLRPAIVPVLTPQEAQPQTPSENESVIAGPAVTADGSAEPSIDTTSVANDSPVIEAERIDQESPTNEAQAIPASDEGAEIEVDMATNAGVNGDIPGADADLLPLGEAVDAPEDTSAQACVEEVGKSAHNQTHLTDQLVIDRFEPDDPQDASADTVASLAEAIPVAQLTTRTYVSDPLRSGEQVPDGDLATLPSAQITEVEADTVDRDLADIANNWPASAISATLQHLRQARGLLPTDLSYDAGWVTAFEADRWHTYQSERQRYISGIRTYLQALGMTPAELKGYLSPLMRYQNGM